MKKVLLGVVLAGSLISLSGCAAWDRWTKSVGSNVGGGLERTVSVYSQDGKLIKKYKGKLDVEANNYGNQVLFDLNGKRIIINNAIVVTEEN